VLNITGLREGKRLQRLEGQRAFDLWKYAFRPEDVSRGHDGLREAYDRFLITNFPLPEGVSAAEDELGDVKAWCVSAPGAPRGNVVLHFHGGGYMIGSAKGSLDMLVDLRRPSMALAAPSTIVLRQSIRIQPRSTMP
jgi:salicylate hydroxylase